MNLLMLNMNSGTHFPETAQFSGVNNHLKKADFLDQPNDHELNARHPDLFLIIIIMYDI